MVGRSIKALVRARRRQPELHHRCEELINRLPIPDPFDVPTFLDRLTARRGRRIELVPAALSATLPCGMLISTDQADYICHAIDATPLHAQHIDMHEVGHLLLDHATDRNEDIPQARPDLAEQAALRTLLPDLSQAMIHRILGRTTYSDRDEHEAEMFASMLLTRAYSVAGGAPGRGDFAERLRELVWAGAPWAA